MYHSLDRLCLNLPSIFLFYSGSKHTIKLAYSVEHLSFYSHQTVEFDSLLLSYIPHLLDLIQKEIILLIA